MSGRGLEDVYCATSPTLEYVLDEDEVPVYIGVGCCEPAWHADAGVCHRYAGTNDDDGCFAGWYDETHNVLGNPKTWDQAVELCDDEGKELCAGDPTAYPVLAPSPRPTPAPLRRPTPRPTATPSSFDTLDSSCDRSLCSSVADDCCAPLSIGEAATCRNGYVAQRTGNGCFGYGEGDYTCCPTSASSDDSGGSNCVREYENDRHCNSHFFGEHYQDLDAALAACAANSGCSGVYDHRCDEINDRNGFVMCDSDYAFEASFTGSCIVTCEAPAAVPTAVPSPVPSPQPSVSPVPTTVSPYSEYIFVEEAVSWNEAVVYCETHYDHLATIRTPSEDAAAVAASLGKPAWIGLSGPPWTWSSGEVVGYTNWASIQPDGDGGCAHVSWGQETGHWNDYNCANGGYVKGFLCEQFVFAPAPSPVPAGSPMP